SSHPPDPGAPRRAFSHAAFSPRKHPQRSPRGEQAVLAAGGGRVRSLNLLSILPLFSHCPRQVNVYRVKIVSPQPASRLRSNLSYESVRTFGLPLSRASLRVVRRAPILRSPLVSMCGERA